MPIPPPLATKDDPQSTAAPKRRSGLMHRLLALAMDVADAIRGRRAAIQGTPDDPAAEAAAEPDVCLYVMLRRIDRSVLKLIDVIIRTDSVLLGIEPRPARRPRAVPPAASPPPAAPARPAAPRPPSFRLPALATLARFGVPGARELSDRIAGLLAEPDMAELMQDEPHVRRAAAAVARACGLGPPAAPRRERPSAASRDQAARSPVRRRDRPTLPAFRPSPAASRPVGPRASAPRPVEPRAGAPPAPARGGGALRASLMSSAFTPRPAALPLALPPAPPPAVAPRPGAPRRALTS